MLVAIKNSILRKIVLLIYLLIFLIKLFACVLYTLKVAIKVLNLIKIKGDWSIIIFKYY